MKKSIIPFLGMLSILAACNNSSKIEKAATPATDSLRYPEESHFKNIQQLTYGGDNAEAYWSFDGKMLVFQRTNPKDGIPCDQIFIGKIPKPGKPFEYKLLSTGKGRTTCAFFTKDNKHVIYASTHLGSEACPPTPDRAKYGNKYIWPLYSSFDIFMADLDGKIVKQLTNSKGYDAEATLSPDGKKMIYTSTKDGDIELYIMDLENGSEKRITNTLGYDGGAWFSPDGTKLIWRASRPKTEVEIKEYKDLLSENLVAPTNMEVWVSNADGSNARQITSYGQANWAPAYMPDSKRIIFASNHEYKRGFPFNLYTINEDGTNLQKISRDKGFDAFPMFSPNGKKIIFCSNRNNGGTRDTNVFLADWVE
ncbi:MAG: PD40 domain-containing protein [Chitinophagaceae bacterium]|nr:PD40 domain-containing protein [Chitinophagaceae bacterium]MBP8243537.1 PD40 domain-containing protein [Chitinophagaceae bacterium]